MFCRTFRGCQYTCHCDRVAELPALSGLKHLPALSLAQTAARSWRERRHICKRRREGLDFEDVVNATDSLEIQSFFILAISCLFLDGSASALFPENQVIRTNCLKASYRDGQKKAGPEAGNAGPLLKRDQAG